MAANSPAWLLLALSTVGCQHVNRRLVTQDEAIHQGRLAAQSITAEAGLYEAKPELLRYVERVGQNLAQRTARSGLPWRFRILNSPNLNAFALPSGDVLISRGLLAHLRDEAQLAAVLSHEIAHITSFHGVSKLARRKVLDAGEALLSKGPARLSDLAQRARTLFVLFHSRQEELEADRKSLEYFSAEGYHPGAFRRLFSVLKDPQTSALPNWQKSHPSSKVRAERLEERLRKLSGTRRNEAAYLKAIDGLLLGDDPQLGSLQGRTLRFPKLGAQLRFAEGWICRMDEGSAVAISPKLGAALTVTTSKLSAKEAQRLHFKGEALKPQPPGVVTLDGRSLRAVKYTVGDDLRGEVYFLELTDGLLILSAQAPLAHWALAREALRELLGSLERHSPQSLASVAPPRLQIRALEEAATARAVFERSGSAGTFEAFVKLNQLAPEATLKKGSSYKSISAGASQIDAPSP